MLDLEVLASGFSGHGRELEEREVDLICICLLVLKPLSGDVCERGRRGAFGMVRLMALMSCEVPRQVGVRSNLPD